MSIILITGGAGFIGSHLIEETLKANDVEKIIVIDDLSTGKIENIPANDRIFFVNGNVLYDDVVKPIFDSNKIDYIVHLAAIASVQDSIDNPVHTHSINFDATLKLLEYARRQGNIKRFVFASSAAVYGDKPDLPCVETSIINPISPYGIDKYAAERFVVNYYKLYGMQTVALRFFNVYGPRQNPKSPYSGVISIFADRIMNYNGEISIFGDGEQTRDFVFVKDVISSILFVLRSANAVGEVYNIGTGIQTSLNSLAKVCAEASGKSVNILHLEARKGDIRHSLSDISKLRKHSYTKTFITIDKGIEILFNSF